MPTNDEFVQRPEFNKDTHRAHLHGYACALRETLLESESCQVSRTREDLSNNSDSKRVSRRRANRVLDMVLVPTKGTSTQYPELLKPGLGDLIQVLKHGPIGSTLTMKVATTRAKLK